MTLRPCLGGCGSLVTTAEPSGRCKNCRRASLSARPSRQTAGRGGGWRADRFRDAVLKRARHQCEAIEAGERCEVFGASRLQAHHVRAIAAGGAAHDPSNGRALCRRHHDMAERQAREAYDATLEQGARRGRAA